MTERLHTRVASGIVLGEDGRFRHDGVLLEHPGLERAFHRGLERTGDGRYVVRFGFDWAYVTVEDAPFLVERALANEGGVRLLIDDGSEELLAADTLAVSSEGVLYGRVKGDHRARFSRLAQTDLAPLLDEDGAGGHVLVLSGVRHAIGTDPGRPPPRPEDGPAPPDDRPPHR